MAKTQLLYDFYYFLIPDLWFFNVVSRNLFSFRWFIKPSWKQKNQIQENQSINNYATLVCVQWTRIMFMSSFTAYDPPVEYFNVKYLAKELWIHWSVYDPSVGLRMAKELVQTADSLGYIRSIDRYRTAVVKLQEWRKALEGLAALEQIVMLHEVGTRCCQFDWIKVS